MSVMDLLGARPTMRWHALGRLMIAAVVVGALGASDVYADQRCARIDQGDTRPEDYRTATEEYKHVVESFHFTAEIQREAMRGDSQRPIRGTWSDLDYTLRRFPNHPRALYMMGIFELRLRKFNEEAWRKLTMEPEFLPSICYFERAARFAPDDAGVPNALGILLHRAGKPEEALKSFQKAVELAPEAPEAHYNLGLSQFALGRYQQAAISARRAYELGYQKQDLKIKLKRKGHWN